MEGLCYRGVMLGVGVGAEEKLLFEATSITINDNEWKGLKFAAFANMQSFINSTKYEPFYPVEENDLSFKI